MVAGAQCVVRGGLMKMLVTCAVDWATHQLVSQSTSDSNWYRSHADVSIATFGQGSGPQYNCTSVTDCTLVSNSCKHIGVRCSSHQEVANSNTTTTGILGAISTILLLALIAVVTALIVTCVRIKR